MKNVYIPYASREELLRDVEALIEQTTDSDGAETFRLPNREADDLRAARREEAQKYALETRRRQELEEKLREITRERDAQRGELERLRADAERPNELRASIRRYADETGAYRAKLAALEAELRPLREENAAYKERETRAKIESRLVDAARKLNCCESALRDVRRLAPLFTLDENGVAADQDGRLLEDALRDEIALSPHWLNRSQGAAANAGNSRETRYADRERFRQALQGSDFADVLRTAPREAVAR